MTDCSNVTSLSPAIEILLNAAETANTITAKITVVSLIPLGDDLFINVPVSGVIFIISVIFYICTKLDQSIRLVSIIQQYKSKIIV